MGFKIALCLGEIHVSKSISSYLGRNLRDPRSFCALSRLTYFGIDSQGFSIHAEMQTVLRPLHHFKVTQWFGSYCSHIRKKSMKTKQEINLLANKQQYRKSMYDQCYNLRALSLGDYFLTPWKSARFLTCPVHLVPCWIPTIQYELMQMWFFVSSSNFVYFPPRIYMWAGSVTTLPQTTSLSYPKSLLFIFAWMQRLW